MQISNMVRDAIKPDLTMFLHYETITADGKKIVVVDIQQGTERPYYIAKKELRPEGVYVRQGYTSVPATNTAIRRMIKETDGDHFEEMRSLEQNLTFESAEKIFVERNVTFGPAQMKTLGLVTQDGVYTNLGLVLSDQCVHTIKEAVFQGTTQSEFKDRKEFSGSLFRQLDEAYEKTGMTPQIETSDNAFKIILPNLNAMSELPRKIQVNRAKVTSEEKVIALTRQQGLVTRKEIESLLGIGQSSCGRLLKKMTENGLLIQKGKGKNMHYCLPQ